MTSKAHVTFCHQLNVEGTRLRTACAADRAAFLEQRARNVDTGLDREAYAAVRRLLGHNRKKPFTPGATNSASKKWSTLHFRQTEIAARWNQHFLDLEAGTEASPTNVMDGCLATRGPAWPTPLKADKATGAASCLMIGSRNVGEDDAGQGAFQALPPYEMGSEADRNSRFTS